MIELCGDGFSFLFRSIFLYKFDTIIELRAFEIDRDIALCAMQQQFKPVG